MSHETPLISETLQIIPDCYHTTTSKNYETICDGGFEPSRGEDQWLGDGVYFWESTLPTAHWWAKERKISPWVIIKAEVKLGACLNLANSEYVAALERCEKELRKMGCTECTDAVVINFIDKNIQKIDTVRASFLYQAHTIYARSRIKKYNPIVCVRNTDNILAHCIQEREGDYA